MIVSRAEAFISLSTTPQACVWCMVWLDTWVSTERRRKEMDVEWMRRVRGDEGAH
jgi:hypothetical protein